jgi:hypothetical protein
MGREIFPRHTCAGSHLGPGGPAICAQRSMQSGEKTQQATQARTRLVQFCISQTSGHAGAVEKARQPLVDSGGDIPSIPSTV